MHVNDLGGVALCYALFALFTGVRSESIVHTVVSVAVCLGAAFFLGVYRKGEAIKSSHSGHTVDRLGAKPVNQEEEQERVLIHGSQAFHVQKQQHEPDEEEASRSGWLYVRSQKWKRIGREKWKYRFVKLDWRRDFSRYVVEYFRQTNKNEFDACNPRGRIFVEGCKIERVSYCQTGSLCLRSQLTKFTAGDQLEAPFRIRPLLSTDDIPFLCS
jgi:hypothetical protein